MEAGLLATKMENYYQKENCLKEEYQRNLNPYIPQWAKMLVELYKSPLKYKVMYEMRSSEK